MRQRLASVYVRARTFGAAQFNRARVRYEAASAKQRRAFWATLALAFIGLAALPFIFGGDEKPTNGPVATANPPVTQPPASGPNIQPGGQTVEATKAQQQFTTHTVARGEFIISIASKLGVPWESIIVANEDDLAARAADRCAKLPKSYTARKGRRGHYCNELVTLGGKPMVAPNSLMPGDVLKIPSVTAPVAIQKAIENVKGNRIVVVIDETGSMAGDDGVDDRERVSSWYLQAVKNSGKQIVKVILFAEGHIRELEPTGWNIQPRGGYENTRAALERAASHKPDAIVLLTDEPGDDWQGFRNFNIPPVIAHSLNSSADVTLEHVARLTRGTMLRSHTGPIALSAR